VVQKVLFETTTEESLFFDPRSLLRENAKRISKNILFKDGELLFFRSHDGPDYSVVWYAKALWTEDGELASLIDQVNLAGDEADQYFGVTIVWDRLERQEAIVPSLIESFRFDPGNKEIADRLFESGRATGSVTDLQNALELAEDRLPAAEASYEIYARRPYGFERRQFADWVSNRVGYDLRFMDLNERVWDWRMDEEEATRDSR
jgi:hypothetical protein